MSSPIRTIVAGISALEEDPLLPSLLDLAGDLGATLHLVHGVLLPDPLMEAYAGMSLVGPDVLESHRQGLQSQLERQVAARSPQGPVVCHAVPGAADQAILLVAEESDADLVVVGSTRRGAIARSVLGTTAQRVLRGATVPTLVMKGTHKRPPHRALIATDLSDLSRSAADRGLEILTALSAKGEFPEVRSVLVIGFDMPLPAPLRQEALEQVAEKQLYSFLEELQPVSRPIQARVRVGYPAKEVVAEAADWDADLLIMGSHSRRGASRFLIGSVAETTLRTVECDVLVIPAAAAAGTDAEVDQ